MEVRVAMAQISIVTGDLKGNALRIIKAMERAYLEGADIVVFPEKALTGYCAGALFEQRHFIEDQRRYLYEDIAGRVPADLVAVIGYVDLEAAQSKDPERAREWKQEQVPVRVPERVPALADLTAVIQGDRVVAVCGSGEERAKTFEIKVRHRNVRLAVVNDGDIWDNDGGIWDGGAELALIVDQSCFAYGKLQERRDLFTALARNHEIPLVYVNAVGVGDNVKQFLIFDGSSMAVDSSGKLLGTLARFAEDFSVVKLDLDRNTAASSDAANDTCNGTCNGTCNDTLNGICNGREAAATCLASSGNNLAGVTSHGRPDKYEEIYEALKFAAQEVFRLSGIKKAQVHLSGGIDSAVVGAIAADAFGCDNTVFITNPTADNAEHLKNLAYELASSLGIPLLSNPTGPIYEETVRQHIAAFGVEPTSAGRASIQAVTRTVQGLAASHTFKTGILAAGNNTEIVLGWASFHDIGSTGVMSLIGDLTKREVFGLADYINRRFASKPIPRILFDQEDEHFVKPAAELADSKEDPIDYSLMSGICALLVRQHLTPEEIIRQFAEHRLDSELFPETIYQKADIFADEVWKAFRMSSRAVFKSGQAAPIPIVAPRRPGIYSLTLGTIINRYLGRYEPI